MSEEQLLPVAVRSQEDFQAFPRVQIDTNNYIFLATLPKDFTCVENLRMSSRPGTPAS